MTKNRFLSQMQSWIGFCLLAIVWIVLSYGIGVSPRYLPRPEAVFGAFAQIEPPLYVHAAATVLRILVGSVVGVLCGVGLALSIQTVTPLRRLLMPSILALRAIPPIATVPFFILWFGFSEWGKFLLVATGIGLNIVVAALQILAHADERFVISMKSFGTSLEEHPFSVALPLIAEALLPTLRTSVAIIFGTVLVSELLGAQLGLGYLIQTARTTYALHTVFLVTLILGVLATLLDQAVIYVWNRGLFWTNRGAVS